MSKKKRFTVELQALAYVRQRRNVMAATKEEAEKKAIETHNNHTLDYMGVQDESVQVNARCTEE